MNVRIKSGIRKRRCSVNNLRRFVSHVLKGFAASLMCGIACVLLFAVSGLVFYVYPKFRDGNALESCKTEEDVVGYFNRNPEEVYFHLNQMTHRGWKLPTRPITNKVLVYTRSATKYYVYIDGDGNVEYVYSSSS